MRKRLKLMLTVIFLFGVFYLFITLDLNTFSISLSAIPFHTWILLLFLQGITMMLIMLQWKMLFTSNRQNLSYRQLINMYAYGVFFESVSPSVKTGGEVAKVIYLNQQGYEKGETSAVILIQKFTSIAVFIMLAGISVLFYLTHYDLSFVPQTELWVIMIGLALMGFLAFLLSRLPFVKRYLGKFHFVHSFNASLRRIITHKQMLSYHLLLSLVVWLLYALKMHWLLMQLDIYLKFGIVLALVLVPYLVSMLPLSIGGIGTFEGVMVLLLLPVGLIQEDALIIAIMFRFTTYWAVFLFSFLWLLPKFLTKGALRHVAS